MSDNKCQCTCAGYCTRRDTGIPQRHFERCRDGEVDLIDRFYSKIPVESKRAFSRTARQRSTAVSTVPSVAIKSQIGTQLKLIIKRETGNDIPCSECLKEVQSLNGKTAQEVLIDAIPLSERIVKRSAKSAQAWYQRAAAKYLPGMVAARVREWIVEACGVQMPVATLPVSKQTRVVCGCIHEGTVDAFKKYITPLIPGVERGNVTPDMHRRIIDTLGHNEQLLAEVIKWNGGTERPTVETQWLPDTWMYAVTSVPSRIHTTLPETLESLSAAGFDNPILFIDDPDTNIFEDYFDLEVVGRSRNLSTALHWHLTLTELWVRNPWSQFYAIFQDDFICCRNLKEYLTKCPLPEKSYLNLLTFMENDVIVSQIQEKGWHQAHTGSKGKQLGRGAVALVFHNTAVEELLSSDYLIKRAKDAVRGKSSIDGGVVGAMNALDYKEYIHNPSLIQHTGTESSMGNRKHPLSKCFSKDFDPLTLL